MNLDLPPQFEALCERLRTIPWCSRAGMLPALEDAVPFAVRSIADAGAAKASIESPAWEDWTLERRNDITSFLHAKHRSRYSSQWNPIADLARGFLEREIEPALLPAMASKFPHSTIAVDAVRWDIAAALMEAAFADCRPPQFFSWLIEIYTGGQVPVGWDGGLRDGVLIVF